MSEEQAPATDLEAAVRRFVDEPWPRFTLGNLGNRHETCLVIPESAINALRWAIDPARPEPRPYIRVDPRMKFGTPVINGHRLGAVDFAERYWHLGERAETEILEPYGLTRSELLAACWYAAEHGPRALKRAWKAWLAETWAATGAGQDGAPDAGWWGDWDRIPLPPTRTQAERRDAAADDRRVGFERVEMTGER